MTSIFRQKKPRQFSYKPVFYDRRKEYREEQLKKYHIDPQELDVFNYTPSIQKGSFRNYHRTTRRNVHTKSNIRLFIIIILLGLLTYIMFVR
ncbi:MAG: hypothetical protein JXB19_06770 [Bacteroidales bacterium]|nr:hypothetical protein [Bacteroidales bacterium]